MRLALISLFLLPLMARADTPNQRAGAEAPVTYSVPAAQQARAEAAYAALLRQCPRIGLVSRDIVEREVDYYQNASPNWQSEALGWKDWIEVRLRTADILTSTAWGDKKYDFMFKGANAFFRFSTGHCSGMLTFKDNGPWLCSMTGHFAGTCEAGRKPP